jgi:hypothetical protein
MTSPTPLLTYRGKLLLISGIALLLLVSAAVYLYRQHVPLIMAAANRALAPYDIRITEVQGIIPGWRSVEIVRMTLAYGADRTTQSLRGIRIEFSPRELLLGRLQDIRIREAILQIPELPVTGDNEVDEPPDILAIINNLSLPFNSLEINRLRVRGWTDNASLRLSASGNNSELSLLTGALQLPADRLLQYAPASAADAVNGLTIDGLVLTEAQIAVSAGDDGTVTVSARLPSAELDINTAAAEGINLQKTTARLDDLTMACDASLKCQFETSFELSILAAEYTGQVVTALTLGDLSASGRIVAETSPSGLRLQIHDGSTDGRVERMMLDTITIQEAEFSASALSVNCPPGQQCEVQMALDAQITDIQSSEPGMLIAEYTGQAISTLALSSLSASGLIVAQPSPSGLTLRIRDGSVNSLINQIMLENVNVRDAAVFASALTVDCLPPQHCELQMVLEAQVAGIQTSQLSIGGLEAGATLQISNNSQNTSVILHEGSRLGLESVVYHALAGEPAGTSGAIEAPGALSANLLELDLPQGFRLDLDRNSEQLRLGATSIMVNAPLLRNADGMLGAHLAIRDLLATHPWSSAQENIPDPNRLTLTADTTLSQIYTNLTSINLWSMRLEQPLRLQEGKLQSSAQLYASDIRLLTVDLQHDLKTSIGSAAVGLEPTELSNVRPLSALVAPLPARFDVLDGMLEGSANVSWRVDENRQWQISGPIQIRAESLAGYYEDIAFAGVKTSVTAELLPDWQLRSTSRQPFVIDSIDAGITISAVSGQYQFDTVGTMLQLDELELRVFDGHVSSETISYKDGATTQEFVVLLDTIDLQQVMSLSAYDAVTASGLLSGRLPVQVQGTTPLVTGGQLRALAPGGSIRYGTGSSGTGNQSLDLVYQALQHYRYEILEANVDYREDGELLLGVRMEGVSPGMNNQRINLNLNVSDNIPALLQSLQAGRNVTEALERQMNR